MRHIFTMHYRFAIMPKYVTNLISYKVIKPPVKKWNDIITTISNNYYNRVFVKDFLKKNTYKKAYGNNNKYNKIK